MRAPPSMLTDAELLAELADAIEALDDYSETLEERHNEIVDVVGGQYAAAPDAATVALDLALGGAPPSGPSGGVTHLPALARRLHGAAPRRREAQAAHAVRLHGLLDNRIGWDGYAAWTVCRDPTWEATDSRITRVTCRDCKRLYREHSERRRRTRPTNRR